MPELDQRIQALPQELQDIIFSFTIAVIPGAMIDITRTYKPPEHLSINHKTREQVAKEYYESSVFTIEIGAGHRDVAINMTATWLKSLPAAHRSCLQELRMMRATELPMRPEEGLAVDANGWMRYKLAELNTNLGDGVIRNSYGKEQEDGSRAECWTGEMNQFWSEMLREEQLYQQWERAENDG